jgi:hypothetical protein
VTAEEEVVPLNFEILQSLEKRVREAESLISHLRRENLRLAEQLDLFQAGGVDPGEESHHDLPAIDPQVLLEQRSRIRSSIHRMLNLLDRIEH